MLADRVGRSLVSGGDVEIVLRIGGFAVSSLIVRAPMAVTLAYAVPLLGALAGFFVLLRPSAFSRRPKPAYSAKQATALAG